MNPARQTYVPGFAQLSAMPDVLRALLTDVTNDEALWRPAETRWSIVQVLGHLRHVEAHGFRGRAELMLTQDNPSFPDYDPDGYAAAGLYDYPTLAAALGAFTSERGKSLAILRSVSPDQLSRPGVHGALGPVVLKDLLHEWPFHDLGHLRQICEILRARKFYPNMGPWQQFYTIAP